MAQEIKIYIRTFTLEDEPTYGLAIEVKNAHADLSTWAYNAPGENYVGFTVYKLDLAKIKKLGNDILEAANKIERRY